MDGVLLPDAKSALVRAVRDAIDFKGSEAEIRDWLAENEDKLVFDGKKKFVLKK